MEAAETDYNGRLRADCTAIMSCNYKEREGEEDGSLRTPRCQDLFHLGGGSNVSLPSSPPPVDITGSPATSPSSTPIFTAHNLLETNIKQGIKGAWGRGGEGTDSPPRLDGFI